MLRYISTFIFASTVQYPIGLSVLPRLRHWQINFVGEDGVDAGGVFREGMSRMVEDLFSPDFDLLIQCPNGRQAIGQVRGVIW